MDELTPFLFSSGYPWKQLNASFVVTRHDLREAQPATSAYLVWARWKREWQLFFVHVKWSCKHANVFNGMVLAFSALIPPTLGLAPLVDELTPFLFSSGYPWKQLNASFVVTRHDLREAQPATSAYLVWARWKREWQLFFVHVKWSCKHIYIYVEFFSCRSIYVEFFPCRVSCRCPKNKAEVLGPSFQLRCPV